MRTLKCRLSSVCLAAVSLLAPVVSGCVADATDAHGTPEPGAETETTSALSVPVVTPCDLAWRKPTSLWPSLYPPASSYDANFYEFEKLLYSGQSLWFAKYVSAARAYERAVVHVDLVRDTDKKTKAGLWFMALIPYVEPPQEMSATMNLVAEFSDKTPVDSITLGYCLDDNTFLSNRWDPYGRRTPAVVVPPNKKIYYMVTAYDPRCTCSAATAKTTAVVSGAVFAAAM